MENSKFKIKKTKFSSYSTNGIIRGCQLCVLGNKSVLFITGLCKRGCYYCPLPESRKGINAVWVNERRLSSVNAISEAIEEIKMCSSKGVGITGGDPLLVLDRVVKFVRALKKTFGKTLGNQRFPAPRKSRRFSREFHIHIYLPTMNCTKTKLEKLAKSGIDEIRFHPFFLSKDEKGLQVIEQAWNLKKKYNWKVGIEIPAVPRTEKATAKFLKTVRNIDFLNLNEFEMPSVGGEVLVSKGMSTIGNSVAIKGSEKTAFEIIKLLKAAKYPIHYCSAKTKNLFQFKNRLKQRLKNVKKPYDIVNEDSDLFHAAIYLPETKPLFNYSRKLEEIRGDKRKYSKIIEKLNTLRKIFIKEFNIPPKLIEIDRQFMRILSTPAIAKFANDIKAHGADIALVTELPTYDRQILQLEWI